MMGCTWYMVLLGGHKSGVMNLCPTIFSIVMPVYLMLVCQNVLKFCFTASLILNPFQNMSVLVHSLLLHWVECEHTHIFSLCLLQRKWKWMPSPLCCCSAWLNDNVSFKPYFQVKRRENNYVTEAVCNIQGFRRL